MIEIDLKNYLGECLPYPVVLEKPEDPPAEYVLLEKTGDSRENHIWTATMAIQTYAGSLYRAAVMAEEAAGAVEDAIELNAITHAEINSIYNDSDRLTKEYRYQVVAVIVYYKGEIGDG